ncbi:MAG TPA: hypothetical protein VGO96_08860 [Pyrinomonadaceae bacterium]|jgi:hypothetical protein|nr:hypothetical protein [Pyrinomonadaceae bacterium]
MTTKSKSTKSAAKAKKSSKKSSKPARQGEAKKSTRSLMSIATSARSSVPERVAALAEAPLAVCESDDNLQSLLKVLRDKNEPSPVRLAALQSLQAASFSVVAFEAARGDYLATLREVAEDTDLELRQRVLGILARENDGFAQKKLLEGLKNPEKALLPPEKALQLLSYDVHAEAYAAAREIVSKPPSDIARREALRLLAADATAAPLFEKLLLDKSELAEIRQISASALQSLKPEKLQEHAREILLDSSEYDEIQATSLTALNQFGDDEAIAQDEALLKSVDRMSDKASTKVKQDARRFLSKFGK